MKYKTLELGDICEFAYGESLIESKREAGQVPVYGSNGIVGWHNQAITKGETIIIGRKGSIGKVHFSAAPCYPIDTTYYIDQTKIKTDVCWLYYNLLAIDLTNLNKSAAVPGLNRNDAYEKKIILPPLEEQKRIAAIAQTADRLRRTRRYALQLSDTYLQSVFLEMFGDPITNSMGWPTHPLDKHLTFITSGARGWAQYYAPSGTRFIRSFDVQMNHIAQSDTIFVKPPDSAETQRTQVQPNDVLLTITGSRIGRVAPIPISIGKAYVSQHVAILRLDKSLHPLFLSMFLSEERGGQEQIRKMQYGQTKPGLNFDQIRAFKIPYPPLPLQEKFAQIVQKFDRLRTQQREAERQAEHLFQTLLHRAFRGELTSQNAEDESESVLLETIRAEQAKAEAKATNQAIAHTVEYLGTKEKQQDIEPIQLKLPGFE